MNVVTDQVNTSCCATLKESQAEMTRSSAEVPPGKVKQGEEKTTGMPIWPQPISCVEAIPVKWCLW